MAAYIITYDLAEASREEYELLHCSIEQTYDDCIHLQESVWVVETTTTAEHICDLLESLLDKNDSLFVAKLDNADWELKGPSNQKQDASWLQSHLL